ncbi:hypothetical protein D187_005228 [Cystobacter fuscus DSM 2262]|uniref:Protein kinase n=1 Tax=Cystobacter fuscus (strain ATCC 25194 / DSM 2262 / NBRC 100088 / M29) TaxID=1242864 RepID=S9PIF3_CYSF2|nr:hypothetical protein [Cystobacter fuscus]EPX64095.1 hypothetical protein D187_005228 [Cystobacter fuscus DSM 2262]
MANEKSGEDRRLGPFRLGRRYDEVGPDLGRLYEARHAATGRPALTLLPGERVEWTPEGDWAVSLFYKRESASVSLRVDEAPPSARASELADLLVLTDAAVRRVEDNPRLSEHLASGPRPWRARLMPVLAGVCLSFGVWLHVVSESRRQPFASPAVVFEAPSEGKAPLLSDSEPSVPQTLAYPLPSRPFRDQAAAPCKPQVDEVEINGGCWLAVKRSPPCLDVQAEYQGTCYLPVSKHRGRPPQSAQP